MKTKSSAPKVKVAVLCYDRRAGILGSDNDDEFSGMTLAQGRLRNPSSAPVLSIKVEHISYSR